MRNIEITNFPKLSYATNEAINTLCTNIFYCGDDIKSILFTSRYEKEGKSNISINVARSLAGLGKDIVIVDADLRRSILARRYQFDYPKEGSEGLAQYLAGMVSLEDVIYKTNIPHFHIIPAGRDVSNSLRLITSPRFGIMMKYLRDHYDTVIVDTPPAGVIVDAVEIASHCDGAVIVVSNNVGRKQEIRNVVENISKTGCKVLGAVMNNVNMNNFRNRKYYYRYGYHSSYYQYYRRHRNDKRRG